MDPPPSQQAPQGPNGTHAPQRPLCPDSQAPCAPQLEGTTCPGPKAPRGHPSNDAGHPCTTETPSQAHASPKAPPPPAPPCSPSPWTHPRSGGAARRALLLESRGCQFEPPLRQPRRALRPRLRPPACAPSPLCVSRPVPAPLRAVPSPRRGGTSASPSAAVRQRLRRPPLPPSSHGMRDVDHKSLYLRDGRLVAGPLQGSNAAREEEVFWVPNRAFAPARLPLVMGIQNGSRCLASARAPRPSLSLQDADVRELPRAGAASAAFTFFRSYRAGLWRFESAANPGWFLCTSARGHQPLGLSRRPDASTRLDFYFSAAEGPEPGPGDGAPPAGDRDPPPVTPGDAAGQ
ncbi:dapper homolog 3-like [Lathamus discolor]|uniref:dapper homolog 3-like n=1 Tax=Lathamus discolor TaxID=678569 RepID=UPI0032B875AB